MEKAITHMELYRTDAFNKITPEQLDSLSCWMFQAWQESEDSLAFNKFYAERFPKIKTGIGYDH